MREGKSGFLIALLVVFFSTVFLGLIVGGRFGVALGVAYTILLIPIVYYGLISLREEDADWKVFYPLFWVMGLGSLSFIPLTGSSPSPGNHGPGIGLVPLIITPFVVLTGLTTLFIYIFRKDISIWLKITVAAVVLALVGALTVFAAPSFLGFLRKQAI